MDAKGGDKQTRSDHEDLKQKEKTTTTSDAVEDFAQGKEEKDERYSLLREAGVNGGVARALSQAYSTPRIKEVINLAKEKNRTNIPGFIVAGLREGWTTQGSGRGPSIDDLIAKYEAEEKGSKNG